MDGAVLLHGMSRRAASMAKMERSLKAAGFATLNLGYDSRRKPLDRLAGDIHTAIADFAADVDGSVHFVTHSMGGLVTRVYLARHRPARLGKVVMLGPPNNGSEIADLLQNRAIYRAFFGPAGQQLTTHYCAALPGDLGPVDYQLGIIAGTKSLNALAPIVLPPEPHDGMVTVRSTRLDGMTDHLIVGAAHIWLMRNKTVIGQTLSFLRNGYFLRA